MKRIAIIDYGAGNLHSVLNAFGHVSHKDEEIALVDNAAGVRSADFVVLPGVGAFAHCYESLSNTPKMIDALNAFMRTGKAFLGICVGMQLMTNSGLEHGLLTQGLGWISGDVRRIDPDSPQAKIPHMGWNALHFHRQHPVFRGLENGNDVYFVHSYGAVNISANENIATTDYHGQISAAIGRDNILGTQFHPEKSQKTGLKIIRNFLDWKI